MIYCAKFPVSNFNFTVCYGVRGRALASHTGVRRFDTRVFFYLLHYFNLEIMNYDPIIVRVLYAGIDATRITRLLQWIV